MDLTLKDKAAMTAALDKLIGRRKGWVLFYRSQWGEGWAKRTKSGIRLWHQSLTPCGGATHDVL